MSEIQQAPPQPGYDRLWLWFSISRAGWVTLPRVLLHDMPDEWQDKMAALLEEYEATYKNWPEGLGSRVQITDHGKLSSEYRWLHNYRRPDQQRIDQLKTSPKSCTIHIP